jgi:hypothetical protein
MSTCSLLTLHQFVNDGRPSFQAEEWFAGGICTGNA